jgi:uncharacterized damage-inducible protein DinB
MTEQNISNHLTEALLASLEETLENAQGMYLDSGTSLFETLATTSAEEASQPISENCASIAAQVEHISYFMEMLLKMVKGEQPQVDWSVIWQTVEKVSPEEWQASQQNLRETYDRIHELVKSEPWEHKGAVRGAMGLIMHNAYHLGEIRQALCIIKKRT